MARALAALGLVVAVVVVVVVATGGNGDAHRFTVDVGEATNVVAGQSIRQSGDRVGRVVSIEPANRGRDARLELEIDDNAWPLPGGTRLQLRWGGTANFGNRYIAIVRGSGSGSVVADGGVLPTRAFDIPVEYDELLTAFPARTRRDLARLLKTSAPALDIARPGLRGTLQLGAPALDEAAAVVSDISADQRAVRTLVRSADNVLAAVDGSQPGVRRLLEGSAATFDAVADESVRLQQALSMTPQTLRRTRSLLALADTTLARANVVVDRIAPGVPAVRRTVAPLGSLLATVRRVGPTATATLANARAATPSLNPLLSRLTTLSPQLGSIGRQAVDNLKCIRPYTPEANAFFSNWGDFHSGTDGNDKMIRAQVQSYGPAFSNLMPINAGQASDLFSGLEYGFPRPPGTVAGQPWFLPECGAGPDALDPHKDTEIRESAKVFDLPRLAPIVPLPKAGR